VRVAGRSITEICALTVKERANSLAACQLTESQTKIADKIPRKFGRDCNSWMKSDWIIFRWTALTSRFRAANRSAFNWLRRWARIWSERWYVLDEPSIGLHPRDTQRLIDILKSLRDLGNTVLVVEHDHDTIQAADHVIDLGPGAGELGGKLLFAGSYDAMLTEHKSLTGRYLNGELRIPIPNNRHRPSGKFLPYLAPRSTICRMLT